MEGQKESSTPNIQAAGARIEAAAAEAPKVEIRGEPDSEDLRRHIDTLHAEVDELRAADIERHKPWYQTASVVISLVALAVTSVFSFLSIRHQYVTSRIDETDRAALERKRKLEDLRQLIVQITDLRNDEAQEQATLAQTNPAAFQQRSSLRNGKRHVLLESADSIVAELRQYLSPNIFTTLAFEHVMDGSWDAADTYYSNAIAAAKDDATRMPILLGQALVYMTPGSNRHDMERGRQLVKRALSILAKRTDEYARQQRVQTLMNYAWMEMVNGNRRNTASLILQAKHELALMNTLNPARQQFASILATSFDSNGQAILPGSTDSIPPVKQLEGRWAVKYTNHPELTGSLTIITATAGPVAAMDVLQGDTLIRKYAGSVTGVNRNTFRIDWMGAKALPMASYAPIAGITLITTNCPSGDYCAVEEIVGESKLEAKLAKL